MVYFITDNTGYTKIGSTNDLDKRIVQLQTGNPRQLFVSRIITHIKGVDDVTVEHSLHNHFAEYRAAGEWFLTSCLDDLFKMDVLETNHFLRDLIRGFESGDLEDYSVMTIADYKIQTAQQEKTINKQKQTIEQKNKELKRVREENEELKKELRMLKNGAIIPFPTVIQGGSKNAVK